MQILKHFDYLKTVLIEDSSIIFGENNSQIQEYFLKIMTINKITYNLNINLVENFFLFKIRCLQTFCVKNSFIYQNVNQPIKNQEIF